MKTGFILAYSGIALISILVIVFLIIPEFSKLYYHAYHKGIKGGKKFEELSEKDKIRYLKLKHYNEVFDENEILVI